MFTAFEEEYILFMYECVVPLENHGNPACTLFDEALLCSPANL